MNAGITQDFIRRIPKTDLHLHLDGSRRPKTGCMAMPHS
jgi:adenosine deaminase